MKKILSMYMLSYVSYSLSVPSPLEIPGKALDVPAKAVASMPGISGFLDKIIQRYQICILITKCLKYVLKHYSYQL